MENHPNPDFDHRLAAMIDHTILKPEATREQVITLCREALEYEFKSVCLNLFWVPCARKLLQGTKVAIASVIGFPLGATSTSIKAREAVEAINAGATELDMVQNIGALKSGLEDLVLEDIQTVVRAAKGKALVKVILETGLLTEAEKITACQISVQAGADFVKTSTGFGPGGATIADITLMRKTVGSGLGVKASGGVRDYVTAVAMIEAGANRIGTSSGINIVKKVL